MTTDSTTLVERRSGKLSLELSCNTQLRCLECGQQNFRICMDADEETDEVSATVVNNVECASCHALYQVKFLPNEAADTIASLQTMNEELKRALEEASVELCNTLCRKPTSALDADHLPGCIRSRAALERSNSHE